MKSSTAAHLTASAGTQLAANSAQSVTLAALFKALGDPLRLQIVRLLKGDSLSVSELCEVFDLRQSALSHHLKILVEAGLLVRRREGTAIFYRRGLAITPDAVLLETLYRSIDAEPLSTGLKVAMARVQQQREENSLAFFRTNHVRFREQQELIASWEDYSQAALHLLDHSNAPVGYPLIEIGPGDGRLLPLLAQRATTVVALDNAPEMLEGARTYASKATNISYVLGDTSTLHNSAERYGAAIMNMVLHHTPKPQQVLAEAGAALAPGGVLIVSELVAHDQAWAREHCGDLWLGFEPDQITAWAEAAGLESRAELFITQRNGFQIQVRSLKRKLS